MVHLRKGHFQLMVVRMNKDLVMRKTMSCWKSCKKSKSDCEDESKNADEEKNEEQLG